MTAAPQPSPPKTTLYCSSCGHESPADGDWIVHERFDTASVDCPDCGTEITRRRRFDRPPIVASTAAATEAWTASWTHSCTGLTRLWRSLLV